MTQVFFHPYLNKFYIFSIWNAFIISCFITVQYVRSKSSLGLGDYMFNKYRAFFTKLTIKCSVYYIEAKTQYIKTGFEPFPKQNSNLGCMHPMSSDSNMIHDVPCQASSKIVFEQRRSKNWLGLSVPGPFQNEDQQQQQLSFLDRSKIFSCYACLAKERGGNRCAQRTELSLEQDRSKKLLRGKGNPRAHL